VSTSRIEQCPVAYLRDSAEIFAGFDLNEDLRRAIVDAPRQKFTPLGEVWCETLGNTIPVGIKKRGTHIEPDRALDEIAIAEALLRGDGSLRTAIPLFTIGLTDGSRTVGILTEDFSHNGTQVCEEDKHRVSPFAKNAQDMPTGFHKQIYEALQGNIYAEALGHMSSIVCGRTVLIDFNEIAFIDRGSVRDIRETVEEYRDIAFAQIAGDIS
jgi:hypothetical protein